MNKRRKTKLTWAIALHTAKKVFKTARKKAKQHLGIYPVVVVAIIPTLIFWNELNIHELSLPIMGRALFTGAAVAVLTYAATYQLVRDQFKASLLSIIVVLSITSYGHFYNVYLQLVNSIFGHDSSLEAHRYFLGLVLLIFVAATHLIKNKLKKSENGLRYLGVIATGFLIFNIFPITKFWLASHKWGNISIGNSVQRPADGVENKDMPDIYYLVFDRYANEKVLKQTYNYDNSPFIDDLKEKGFYVASDSVANYPFTTPSLASSLNLDYIPEKYHTDANIKLLTGLFNEIEDSHTAKFLKSQGYYFTNIGSWWDTTKYNKNADQNLLSPMGPVVLNKKIDLARHELLLLEDTIFWPILKKPLKLGNDTIYGLTFDPYIDLNPIRNIHRQTNLHEFEMVKQASKKLGPKFVFGHFLMPHDPYVFKEDCTKLIGVNEYYNYLKQIQCANKKIQETVDYILAHSENDPIIIIQSDEGPYPVELRKNKSLDWDKASDELLHQKAKILNAYYFPDKDYSKLYQDITPVNSFRVVFNQYFNTEMPLLEDKNYIYNGSTRFDFYDVTNRFKN